MSPEHYRFIRSIVPSENKTYLIKTFPEKVGKSNDGVDDPIGQSLENYARTFMELDEIIRRILPDIIALAENKEKND
jgi:protein-tyrosine-phosphatase